MLVLTRRPAEQIVCQILVRPEHVGQTIQVLMNVIGVEGDRVRLGFEAPPEVVIVRRELLTPPGAD